jgi:hypothetical protein
VVSAVHLFVVRADLHPTSDLAGTELLTRDVGRRMVLLGPYSRDGWHHPGPLAAYVYAVPYRLLGSSAAAMGAAALLVNAAAVAGMAVVARRRGGPPLALLTLVAGAVLVRALGPDVLRVPWNPYVTVLPYGLLVFLTWALLARDRWALPAAVFTFSFVAQTHAGYVALGLPLLAVGAGGLVVGTLRSRPAEGDVSSTWRARARPLLAPVATAVAVGAVVWAPPVYEELTRSPGNLTEVVRWFDSGEPTRGWGVGWRLVSGQYGVVPEWLTGLRAPAVFTGEPRVVDEPVLPVLLLLVVAAVAVLVRRRVAGGGALAVAWLVASVAGIAATARVIGPAYAYRTGWTLVLGAVGGLLVAWAAGREVAVRIPNGARLRRAAAPVALAVLAVLAATTSLAFVRAGVPEAAAAARIGGVAPDVLAALPAGDGPVLVDGRSGWGGLIQAPGLVLELEREGVDARLAGSTAVGAHRSYDGGALRARLVIAAGGSIPAAEAAADRTLVAYDGILSLRALRARVAAGETVADDDALAVFLADG